MPRNDYADAYSDPGQSAAGDSDAPNLTWEWWNEMADGGAQGDAFIADPDNRTVRIWAGIRRNAWANKVQQVRDRLADFAWAARVAACCVCPEWLIAIWWDERARMAVGEQEMDNMADGLGIDTSTGPFQMTGATAASVIAYAGGYAPTYAAMTGDELQDAMQENFQLAAALAADRMCQIMAGYKAAGWDPCKPGSLSAIELIGTLYSQGLGRPNAAPTANGRGTQIAAWAHEAVSLFGLTKCDCDCNQSRVHRAETRAPAEQPIRSVVKIEPPTNPVAEPGP